MSAFEKLPREIRDMIYERHLLHKGEIVPFPCNYDKKDAKRRQGSVNYIPRQTNGQHPLLGFPNSALLGVNSTIRDEAASILFGKNVWRLCHTENNKHTLWETFAKYFRHVVTRFDCRDFDEALLLDISIGEMNRPEEDSEDSDHFDPMGSTNEHAERLEYLRDGFIAKKSILGQMDLKSLSFDFSNLYCPTRCCRYEALQSCLTCLGSSGPWYKLEQERGGDSRTKLDTKVEILGLKDQTEKELFRETWGLEVE